MKEPVNLAQQAKQTHKRIYDVKWAYSSMGMPEADLATLLNVAEGWGIEELELRTLEDSIDLPDVLAKRFQSPIEFASYLERSSSVEVSVLSGSLRLAKNVGKDRADFLAYVPWAEAAGVKWLRAFDFVGPYAPWTEEMFEQAVDTLRWWKMEKEKHGWSVEILVEGHHRMFYPDMYYRVGAALGWNPPLLYDLGHALSELGNEGALATYQELRHHIPRVHLKDPAVVVPGGMKHSIPGQGTGNLEELMDAFVAQGTPPVVTLEWERQWEKRLPELSVAFEALRAKHWL
ncbi:sugar phosphate isomerase/epimerase family protein [Cerasicoccus maritimus]|uniref:sugar phosphate isomerase/epimerase family protein n=1 Tax=Cerasicoccus maritimus TaxID=490089 RepID=UPI0028526542|nr:hypothetical protein [Cerasicoccus maritimus]